MAEEQDLRARPRDADEEALPLPSGKALYESLTAKFIAFDRLLNTLAENRYSGYIRLLASGSNGVILFRDGQVVDSLHRQSNTLLAGDEAMGSIERLVESGHGVLDVVTLEGELIDGLHHLASGVAAYPDMRASWINAPGLVDFLKSRHFTGALSIRSDAGAGVIMFDDGTVTGAFTTESRAMGADPATVLALCSDPEAQLEVHAAAGRPAHALDEPAAAPAQFGSPAEDLAPESQEQVQEQAQAQEEEEEEAGRTENAVSRFL